MKVVYYHNDMDGICSAAIINRVYSQDKGEIKFVPVQYGQEWKPEDVKGAEVFVVDFSFQDMGVLNSSCENLVWIDHHKTAMDKFPELWASKNIEGIRSLRAAGCELTWEHFCPGEDMPEVIKVIGDRDMWIFKYPDTKEICEVLHMQIDSPTYSLWNDLIDYGISKELKEKGKLLLLAKNDRIKKSFETGSTVKFENHYCRIINTNHDTSDTGELAYKEFNYPVVLIWSVRHGKIVFSLRSNSVNVREIAEKYGGGGHELAAGFKKDVQEGLDLIKKIMESEKA